MVSDCIPWTGYISKDGYGLDALSHLEAQQLGLRPGIQKAHRLIWHRARGPIPKGLVLDHLCHNAEPDCNKGNKCLHRRCVNLDHMEMVTIAENIRRGRSPDVGRFNRTKTHCAKGHEYTTENTEWRRNGTSRVCKECRSIAAGSKRRWSKKGSPTCVNGHVWAEDNNLYVNKKGSRVCRACKRDRGRARYALAHS